MTSNERFRQLTIQHSDCLDQIQKEWQRADETMLEYQIAGIGRGTGGYEKIAAHERGMACSLVTDYHDRVIMPLLPHVDELLQRELIAFADRLYEDIKDPRKPWSTRYRERRSKLDRLLGARVQAEEIAARETELKPPVTEEREATALDDLVTLDQAAAVVSLKKRTLERYLQRGDLPRPDLPGGGGKSHRWYWSTLRPALEKHFRPDLPAKFPASRVI